MKEDSAAKYVETVEPGLFPGGGIPKSRLHAHGPGSASEYKSDVLMQLVSKPFVAFIALQTVPLGQFTDWKRDINAACSK